MHVRVGFGEGLAIALNARQELPEKWPHYNFDIYSHYGKMVGAVQGNLNCVHLCITDKRRTADGNVRRGKRISRRLCCHNGFLLIIKKTKLVLLFQ